ncbi:MAG TPA: hypothetical protein VG454_02190 [Gemmatimonadales bacterium]|nr:hypothetical protein [Gemmatimonadales bacterium]
MKTLRKAFAVLAALAAVAAACNEEQGPAGLGRPSFDRAELRSRAAAPLVIDSVPPQATDPAIDQALDRHYVWLDTTARSNHKLFVFMAGHAQHPAMFQRVPEEAARLGYHVIGLTYPDAVSVLGVCRGQPSSCYENLHWEILDGEDRSPFVQVNQANSIENRLAKLLQFLADSFPEQRWSRFLADGKPKWSEIAISGHSQGGGEAAIIAKLHVVARVVLFSSVVDGDSQSVSFLSTHVTPSQRYWGLAHDRDGNFRRIRAGWDSLGMAAFGPAVAPETSSPPYGFTHMLVTDLVPQGGFIGSNAHGAPSNDANTPLNLDGSCCRLRDAWRYLLTARTRDEDNDRDEDRDDDRVGDDASSSTFGPWSAPVNLNALVLSDGTTCPAVINSSADDQHPAISRDGLTLIFTSNRANGLGDFDLWVTHRASEDACWQPPANLTAVNSPTLDYAPNLTPDGRWLFFHSRRAKWLAANGDSVPSCGGADLYVSHRRDRDDDFAWEAPVNLGCTINAPGFDQAGPTYFDDDATGIRFLYYTQRPIGAKDTAFDIYVSSCAADLAMCNAPNGWGPGTAVAALNSPYRDTRTAIRRDGLEMILSSGRPGSLASENLWVSTRLTTQDQNWLPPVPINCDGKPACAPWTPTGPLVNSPAFDGAPALSWHATELYFFSKRSDLPGHVAGLSPTGDKTENSDLYVSARKKLTDSDARQ